MFPKGKVILVWLAGLPESLPMMHARDIDIIALL